jgi:glutamine amidotransferase
VIGIVDIEMGNLRSISNAIDQLGFDVHWVRGPADLDDVTHCVLPGVGNFHAAAKRVQDAGLTEALRAFPAERPLLGICLGMHLLADRGDEGGGSVGLGLIPGHVRRIDGQRGALRVPHVGWNAVDICRPHPLFEHVKPGRDFYFVHSYHFDPSDPAARLAETEYGVPLASAVAKGRVVGLQFHPEKSQANGLKVLEAFCDWTGA